ncbi:hypothetical protein U9M48_004161 [Paspalum notatum var. saurae]|uniref:DUF8040 domain-containing protein n=1 Tax=Paspalum notatum var. saurae TaxID=547442 RepID=A0AAQ3PUG4_PASNO
MPAAGHQSASRAAGAGRAQFAGTLHHDAALEAAYGDGVYGLGGSGTASYGHTIYGHGTNVEDGDVEAAVQYFREGDDGYIPPDATNDQYYSLDMNGDTSHDRTRGRGLGRSCRFTQPRQAPSAVGRGRGRGCSRGRGLTTFVNDVQPIVSAGQNANATVVNGSTSQRSAKNPVDSQGDMDWSVPKHVSIVCSLFADQVEKEQMGKLKGDLTAWRKLMRRQTGTGWDHLRQTIEMDPEWWRNIKAEIPRCAKFKKLCTSWDEADLTKMFDKITNDESDHWNPMTENPIIPENAECEIPNDFTSPGSDVVKEVSPSVGNGKKRPRVVLGKPARKTKTSTAAVMQEQVTRIADSADALVSKKLGEVTIKQVMELVVACGAAIGSNEHFIASKLFIKREQREMFMTLDTHESRFLWLCRHYNEQRYVGLHRDDSSTDSDEEYEEFMRLYCQAAQITTSYVDVYVDKNPARTSTLSGMRWLNETLNSPEIFMDLHDILVTRYSLQPSLHVSTYESLAIFLFICGGNESNRRSQNRFKHSGETISRKFDEVLDAVMAMGKDFIGPKNPNFSEVYLSPDDQVRYIGKSGIPTQNPGSMHDTSVLYTAIKGDEKFFPHPPRGKYYVLDAGYPNRPGYLARYKGERYHMPE